MLLNPLKRLIDLITPKVHYVYDKGTSRSTGGGGTSSSGGGHPSSSNSGFGSSDWEPDSNTLVTLTGDQIAEGYGLDPGEFGSYFESFDGWKGNFAQDQFEVDQASLEAKKDYDIAELQSQSDVLGLEQQETETKLSDTLSQNIMASSDAYSDTMAQMIDSQASGLMGGASSRAARTMGQRSQERTDVTASGATKDYGATTGRINQALEDITRKTDFVTDQFTRDEDSLELDRDYTIRQETEQFKDSIYDTLDALGSQGVFDMEGASDTDWINKITGADSHWEASDFDDSRYNQEFLEWFFNNQGSVDRDMMSSSKTEVSLAYDDWSDGKAAGSSSGKGTWCCTAATETGHMSQYKTARLGVWHRQQSKIWQEGYHVWGKIIADHLISRYDWAGRWTEAFYQIKVRKKRSKQGIGAILFIAPMSYLIGTFKAIFKGFKK